MSSSPSLKCLWGDLLQGYIVGLDKAIDELNTHNVESTAQAIQLLLDRLEVIRGLFPINNGRLFLQTIDNVIQETFFPDTRDFAIAFEKILNSRTHDQDFIINELLNGFVVSKTKSMATDSEIPLIDRMVEAFSKRYDFHIVDHQFYAMFGDPNNPRAYVMNYLDELSRMFGLVTTEKVVEKDVRRSERKVYKFYTFPDAILDILKVKYLKTNPISGNYYVSEDFDRNVFICLYLANITINRNKLELIGGRYTVNGISAIIALILIVSFMPSVPAPPHILNHPSYSDRMRMIPKSWLMKDVLEPLFEPLIKITAYRIGGELWCNVIIDTEINEKIHTQLRFLLKDVNKWILGELVRVEIPVFADVLNIIQINLEAAQTLQGRKTTSDNNLNDNKDTDI